MADCERRVRPLKGTGQWVIYRDDTPRWRNILSLGFAFPYAVVGPDGTTETVCATRWGALRALAKLKARPKRRQRHPYRDPETVIYEDGADG